MSEINQDTLDEAAIAQNELSFALLALKSWTDSLSSDDHAQMTRNAFRLAFSMIARAKFNKQIEPDDVEEVLSLVFSAINLGYALSQKSISLHTVSELPLPYEPKRP